MKAIIIAAGKGSRIPEISNKKPKCFIKINNQTLLERQIKFLKKNNVNNIVVVTGHKSFFFKKKNIKYIKNNNYSINEQLDSLMCAKKEFNNDIIVLFSDIIYDEKFLKNILNLREKKKLIISCQKDWKKKYKNRLDHPYGQADKVKLFRNNVIKIGKKIPLNQTNSEFIGIFKIPRMFCSKFIGFYKKYKKTKISNNCQIHDFLSYLIHKKQKIKALNIKGNFMEIDTYNDYKIAKKIF